MLAAVCWSVVLSARVFVPGCEPGVDSVPVFVLTAESYEVTPAEEPPIPGSMEYQENLSATVMAGHECKEYDGCPKGSPFKDSSGNVTGCSLPPGVPGPTNPCTGSCTVCAGSGTTVKLCSLKALSSCTLPNGAGSGQACGNKASSACGWAGANQGVNGCSGTIPASFPGDACTLTACE